MGHTDPTTPSTSPNSSKPSTTTRRIRRGLPPETRRQFPDIGHGTRHRAAYVAALGDTVDVWSSVNPTAGPARADCGRGTAEQVTRLAGLWADLDVKPGACADIATAEAIIDELSALLGPRPAVVVFSGHGLQPHWVVEDGDITDTFTTDDAAALLAVSAGSSNWSPNITTPKSTTCSTPRGCCAYPAP